MLKDTFVRKEIRNKNNLQDQHTFFSIEINLNDIFGHVLAEHIFISSSIFILSINRILF